MGLAESILALLALVAGGAMWYIKRRAEQKDAVEPAERDKEIDRAFADKDPHARATELQSLDDRLRRAEVEADKRAP